MSDDKDAFWDVRTSLYTVLSIIKSYSVYTVILFFPHKKKKDNSEPAPLSNGALKCTCYEDYHCEAA